MLAKSIFPLLSVINSSNFVVLLESYNSIFAPANPRVSSICHNPVVFCTIAKVSNGKYTIGRNPNW